MSKGDAMKDLPILDRRRIEAIDHRASRIDPTRVISRRTDDRGAATDRDARAELLERVRHRGSVTVDGAL